jgi:magnesium chelatase family protein
VTARPFRAPHHSASLLHILGGGKRSLIGEISLAHRGVLFLDDATEFAPNVLHGLDVALSKVSLAYPLGPLFATMICVAAVQPCPCGWHGNERRTSRCSEDTVRQHLRRFTPLAGHFDLKVDLSPAGREAEVEDANESSAVIRARVTAARERQLRREPSLKDCLRTNGLLTASQLLALCSADAMELVADESRTSLAILRVARTIADLADAEKVEAVHVQEATRYQPSWP